MGLVSNPIAGRSAAGPAARELALGGLWFDRWMALLGGALIVGAHIDGWAHNHGRVDQSFFTPYHAILYGAFLVVAAFTFGVAFYNRRRGDARPWPLPAGYELTLAGVVLFGLAGLGDMVWHLLFGIEKSVDALYSPTHLLLLSGGILIAAGPLRAAWRRHEAGTSWARQWPLVLSFAFTLSSLTFITQPFHPFGLLLAANPAPVGQTVFFRKALGMASIIIQTGLLMGLLLAVLTRTQLPFGSLTLILTLNTLLVVSQDTHDDYYIVLAAVLGGLVADLLLSQLAPSLARPRAWLAFGFAVPACLYVFYFALLMFTGGVWWTIHFWAGAIFIAGIVGFLLAGLLQLAYTVAR